MSLRIVYIHWRKKSGGKCYHLTPGGVLPFKKEFKTQGAPCANVRVCMCVCM